MRNTKLRHRFGLSRIFQTAAINVAIERQLRLRLSLDFAPVVGLRSAASGRFHLDKNGQKPHRLRIFATLSSKFIILKESLMLVTL